MINKILISILASHFLMSVFIHSLSDSIQFFVWNFFLLCQSFLLCICLGLSISYKNQKEKALCFAASIFCGYGLVDFVAEWSVADSELYNYVVVIFSVILFCGIFPFAGLIVSRSLMPRGSEYNSEESFLVYKKPVNWSGLIGMAFQAPYGHCSLVTQGRVFKFKRGELIEEDYFDKKDNLHIKILPVKLEEARKLLGTEWSLNNNCFNVFKKFNRD